MDSVSTETGGFLLVFVWIGVDALTDVLSMWIAGVRNNNNNSMDIIKN